MILSENDFNLLHAWFYAYQTNSYLFALTYLSLFFFFFYHQHWNKIKHLHVKRRMIFTTSMKNGFLHERKLWLLLLDFVDSNNNKGSVRECMHCIVDIFICVFEIRTLLSILKVRESIQFVDFFLMFVRMLISIELHWNTREKTCTYDYWIIKISFYDLRWFERNQILVRSLSLCWHWLKLTLFILKQSIPLLLLSNKYVYVRLFCNVSSINQWLWTFS